MAVEHGDDGGLLGGGEAVEAVAAGEFSFEVFSGFSHAVGVIFKAVEFGIDVSFQLSFVIVFFFDFVVLSFMKMLILDVVALVVLAFVLVDVGVFVGSSVLIVKDGSVSSEGSSTARALLCTCCLLLCTVRLRSSTSRTLS